MDPTRPDPPPPDQTRIAEPDRGLSESTTLPALLATAVAAPPGPKLVEVWKPGDVLLDLYEVLQVLGEGGMGTVWKVRHRGWDLELAVKTPQPDVLAWAGGAESFEREAETWVNLGLNPHVVSCYYVRRISGIPRVFAEYVAGGSLEEWIHPPDGSAPKLYAGGPEQALERILDVAIQFAWGLHHAHENGLIHQDVKPHNVMMTAGGLAKVTDFGLSRAVGVHGDRRLAGAQSRLVSCGGMTPAYCSPEQAERRPLSRQTDVWSWGVSLLEAFTGDVTWPVGQAAAEALEGYLEMGAGDPALSPMPPGVRDLLRRCFQRDPAGRPRDMLEVASALEEVFRQVTGQSYPRQRPRGGEVLADSLNNRALSLLDLGKQAEAEATWEKALAGEGLHPEANYNLGLLRWRRGAQTDVTLVQRMSEVCAAQPGAWLPTYLLAQVHLERGDPEAALVLLRPLVEDDRLARTMPVEKYAAHVLGRPLKETDPERREAAELLLRAAERLADQGELVRWSRAIPPGQIEALSLSPDGNRALFLATRTEVGAARRPRCTIPRPFLDDAHPVCLNPFQYIGQFWDLASDRRLKEWTGSVLVKGLGRGMSLEGRYLLMEDLGNKWQLWDAEAGKKLTSFFASELPQVSRDYPALAAVARLKQFLERLQANEKDFDPGPRHPSGVMVDPAACISADGRVALIVSGHGRVTVWDVATARCLRTLEGHTAPARAACLRGDGAVALTGGHDDTVRIWETATGRCLRTIPSLCSMSLSLSDDNRYALVARADEYVKLWRIGGAGPWVAPLRFSRVVASEMVLAYARSLDQARAALAAGDAVATVQHLRRARGQPGCAHRPEALQPWQELYTRLPRTAFRSVWERRRLEAPPDWIHWVSLSADGRLAVAAGEATGLTVWDVSAGRYLRTLTGHTRTVQAAAISADGKFAASASGDRTVKLWDLATGRCLKTFDGHSTWVSAVALSADGLYILSGSGDGTARLWHADRSRPLRTFRHGGEVTCVALSPDERLAVSCGDDNTIQVHSVSTGEHLSTLRGHRERVNAVSLSADGRSVLSASADGSLRLWMIRGGCLTTFRGHEGGVNDCCLSGDGRFALSGGEDRTLRLWETTSGRCVHLFEQQKGKVTTVALSGDGRCVLSGGIDQGLHLWLLDWELEEKLAADSSDEARTYLEQFLAGHTPYRQTTRWDYLLCRSSLEQEGKPEWDEEEFRSLLGTLGRAGLGWLRPEGVRRELERLADPAPEAAPSPEVVRGGFLAGLAAGARAGWQGAPMPILLPPEEGPPVRELPLSGLSLQDGVLCRRNDHGEVRGEHPVEQIRRARLRSWPRLTGLGWTGWLGAVLVGGTLAALLLERDRLDKPLPQFLIIPAVLVMPFAALYTTFRLLVSAYDLVFRRNRSLRLDTEQGTFRYPLLDRRKDCERFVKELQREMAEAREARSASEAVASPFPTVRDEGEG
jgi:WD40 repeat protein/serine/threonine protein kinase